jgi:hypothetical protein
VIILSQFFLLFFLNAVQIRTFSRRERETFTKQTQQLLALVFNITPEGLRVSMKRTAPLPGNREKQAGAALIGISKRKTLLTPNGL